MKTHIDVPEGFFDPPKSVPIGWMWRVKAADGKETATHDWVARTKKEAVARMLKLYPEAWLVSAKKMREVMSDDAYLYMPFEGYIYHPF